MATIEEHRERQLDDQRWQALHELSLAALEWWRNKRPTVYREEQHLLNPEINCTDEPEKKLARACAKMTRRARALKEGT